MGETISFLERFRSVLGDLERLSGMRFTLENPDNNTVIGKILADILSLHNAGKQHQRDYELSRMDLFARHLSEIKSRDAHIFRELKRKIYRCDDAETFFGVRFELSIAATLSRGRVNYSIPLSSPDFQILLLTGDRLEIECGYVRMQDGSANSSDPLYRISTHVIKKSTQNYCGNKTAVFLDITNPVDFNLNTDYVAPTFKILKTTALHILNKSHFGSIVLFQYSPDENPYQLKPVHFRCDSSKIHPLLLPLLDTLFPIPRHISAKNKV